MGKWILIPDSFKGTMSSEEICTVMAAALRRHLPEADIVSVPVADGGEGSVDAFLTALGGRREEVPCTGPDGRPITAFYGRLPDGTAVVEMAAAAGLPLMEGHLCAEGATTYGVGELLRAAVHAGAKRVILGLGGSATNDGGSGHPLSGPGRSSLCAGGRHTGPAGSDRCQWSGPGGAGGGHHRHVRH